MTGRDPDEGADDDPRDTPSDDTPGFPAEDATVVDRDRESTAAKPPAPGVDDSGPTIAEDGALTWFRTSNHGAVVVVRDIVSSVATVAAIGLILFAISGIWPPLVAVESGSMEPHMSKGDLVFIVDETRYAPQSSVDDTGVSTLQSARDANGYWKFGNNGDVIVYKPSGGDGTPIIHRARFHVEEGENWIDRADPAYLGAIDECDEVPRNMCPAPYDGFITKGDANPTYDQIGDQSTIVKSEWIRGKAAVRIPLLGWIRLQFADLSLAIANASGQTVSGASGLVARVSALAIGLRGLAPTSPV